MEAKAKGRSFMLQIFDKSGAKYILPVTKMFGTPEKLRARLTQDPTFVTLIKLPEACMHCKFNLIPVEVAQNIMRVLNTTRDEFAMEAK